MAFSASASARRVPSGSRKSRISPGSRVPANAELPRRLRPTRAPSSSAQSTRASGRGGGSPASIHARSTPIAASTPSAPSSQPPDGTESRCEPSASPGARLPPSSHAQRFPASSRSGSSPISASSSLRKLRASRQVCDHATRRAPSGPPVRRSSSRKSVITRAASIRGASLTSAPLTAEPLAPKRLGEAMGPAAAEREHLQVRIEDLEPAAAQRLVEAGRTRRGEHAVAAERDRVRAEREGIVGTHLHELEAAGPQPRDEPERERIDAGGQEPLADDAEEHVDVDPALGDRLDPNLPSVCSKPGGELVRSRLLGARLAGADQRPPRLEQHHI